MKPFLEKAARIFTSMGGVGRKSILGLTITLGLFGLVQVPVAHAGSVLDTILSPLSAILMMLGGAAVGIAGVMLNWCVNFFVVQMGQMLGSSTGITEAWSMVRDVVNLTFVFGLVYVGIMTIVKGESSQTREWLVRIIIGALLVNFSLFFAKVIVDISNVAAIEIYNFEDAFAGTDAIGTGLSGAFMQRIGLQQELMTINWDQDGEGDGGGTKPPPFLQAVIFMFLCLVAAFVFGAAAILLAIRFAVIVLLLVLSPVMFVASFLPVAGGWSRSWWNAMISQSLFAPAFLFTSWVSIKVLDMIPQINLVGTASGSSNPGAGNADAILSSGMSLMMTYYAISMVMLVTGLIVAKQMGAYGASTAVSIGRSAARSAGRLAMAPVQAGGRWTLGRGAQGVRKWSENAGAALRDSQAGRSSLGKLASVGARGVVRAGGAAAGKVEKTKFGGRSIVDAQKASEERGRTLDRASRANNLKTAIAAGIQPGSALTQAQKDAVGSMSFNELKDLGAEKVGKLAAQGYLTDDQAKKIKDSKDEDFSPADRASIETARLGYFENQVKTGTAIDDGKVRGLSPDAITKLPKPVLEAVISDAAGLSALVDRINVGNLKQMVKDKVKPALRDNVSSEIQSRTGGTAWSRPAGPRSSWTSNDHKLRDWLESPDGSDF